MKVPRGEAHLAQRAVIQHFRVEIHQEIAIRPLRRVNRPAFHAFVYAQAAQAQFRRVHGPHGVMVAKLFHQLSVKIVQLIDGFRPLVSLVMEIYYKYGAYVWQYNCVS